MGNEGFFYFFIGSGDEEVGKKAKRFTAENNTAYRATFCWYSVKTEKGWDDAAAFDKEGKLVPPVFNDEGKQTAGAQVRFTGCERIYLKGVGNFLYKSPAYAEFGQPKQYVATIIVVWPTDKEGDLDVAAFSKGKGYAVMPWIFSTDKYNAIKKSAKRFSLMDHDMTMACPENGAEYQKLTFTPETANLLRKLMSSEKPEANAIAAKILADVKALAMNINRELAQDLTIEQIREKLGGGSSPTGTANHAAKDVDDLLGDLT